MALSVIQFESISDSLDLNFELPAKERWIAVCPNPTMADAMRKRMEGNPHNCESITISKFLGNIYQEIHPDQGVTRKSELLRILATVWKLKFGNESTFFFEQAFELFTDLRSFTLNPEMIENLLEHYDPIVAQAVRYFWLVTEEQSIVDEHMAYNLILQGLEAGEFDANTALENTGLLFQGFTHLSGGQIDLLKSLGRYCEVIVPIPQSVQSSSLKTDWVDWINSQADIVKTQDLDSERISRAKIIECEKSQKNEAISELSKTKNSDLVFMKGSLSFQQALEISKRNLFFKTELDLFKSFSTKYRAWLDSILTKTNTISASELIGLINDLKANILSLDKTFLIFIEIKFLGTLVEEIEAWSSLSNENENIDRFSANIVWEVLTLNLPRNFNIPLLKEKDARFITLKELADIDSEREIIILVDEGHDLVGSNASRYSTEVSEILFTLGPIRRKGLDVLFYKTHIEELLYSENSTLLIEKGLLEHDKTWNQIVSKVLRDGETKVSSFKSTLAPNRILRKSHSVIEHEPAQSLSASRLQTYIDCPKKYYYSYILKMGKEPPRFESVDPRLLGNFEHEIVQKYLNLSSYWDLEVFNKIVNSIVILPNSLAKSALLLEETLSEVRYYSEVMIKNFLKILELDPSCSFSFESPMKGAGAVGFADVYIKSEKFGKMLFDLKRSSGSIPTKSEVLKMRSIQLWHYMEFIETKREFFDVFGYLNFSNPSDSLVFGNNKDSIELLEEIQFLNIKSINFTGEDFDNLQDDFREVYNEVSGMIKKGIEFPAHPISAGACHFCPGNIICTRGSNEQ